MFVKDVTHKIFGYDGTFSAGMCFDADARRTGVRLGYGLVFQSYAAPKRTDTSFETPGSCMVTP